MGIASWLVEQLAGNHRGDPYRHMMFDHHEVVLADGARSENFQPGERSSGGLDKCAHEELFKVFPELSGQIPQRFDSARMTLKEFEAKILLVA